MEAEEGTTAEAAPAPRWNGAQCLVPVQKFNEHCIEQFCSVARRDDADADILRANADLWKLLDAPAKRRLSSVQFVFVDIRFHDEYWWRQVVDSQGRELGSDGHRSGLPSDVTEDLMYETLMFCWQLVSSHRTVAMTVFAMTPGVLELVADLTPKDVRNIAARQGSALQVRWSADADFWRSWLQAALDADMDRLASLQMHAKTRLCGELVRALG